MQTWFKKTIILILALEAIFFIAPRIIINFDPAAILVSLLGDLTNQERQSENLPALKVNPLLSESAALKAEDMAKNGYFAHVRPSGLTPWYWLDKVGYTYDYAGENLAVNFTNTEDVTAAWMQSPTHRANIEKSQYTEIGSAIATGTYKGKETIFVVQVYANPRTPKPETVKTSVKIESTQVAVAEQAGEVLGTSTKNTLTAAPLDMQELSEPIVPKADNSRNTILFIILGSCIIVFIVLLILKFTVKHVIMNILLLAVFVVVLFLINGNFLQDKIFTSTIDYSEQQTR